MLGKKKTRLERIPDDKDGVGGLKDKGGDYTKIKVLSPGVLCSLRPISSGLPTSCE